MGSRIDAYATLVFCSKVIKRGIKSSVLSAPVKNEEIQLKLTNLIIFAVKIHFGDSLINNVYGKQISKKVGLIEAIFFSPRWRSRFYVYISKWRLPVGRRFCCFVCKQL